MSKQQFKDQLEKQLSRVKQLLEEAESILANHEEVMNLTTDAQVIDYTSQCDDLITMVENLDNDIDSIIDMDESDINDTYVQYLLDSEENKD